MFSSNKTKRSFSKSRLYMNRTNIDYYGRYISDKRIASGLLKKYILQYCSPSFLSRSLLHSIYKKTLHFLNNPDIRIFRTCTLVVTSSGKQKAKFWVIIYQNSFKSQFLESSSSWKFDFHLSYVLLSRPYYTGWVVQKMSRMLETLNRFILTIHQVIASTILRLMCASPKSIPCCSVDRRKIRLIEINAKCRHWPVKGLCAGVYLSEGPSRPRFLFEMVQQFCRFWIWSDTEC